MSTRPVASAIATRTAEICIAGSCAPFGLEPKTLGDVSDKLPGLLALPRSSPAYAVFINGKAAYSLASTADGALVAVTDGCDAAGQNCTFVRQAWRAAGPGAAVHRQSALTPLGK